MKERRKNITESVTGPCYNKGTVAHCAKETTEGGDSWMTNRAWGAEYRTTTVCIDSYENAVPVGCFYNPYLEQPKHFRSLTQFLMEMERALDAMDFPRAFTASRSFASPPAQRPSPPEEAASMGKTATFAIKVLFRQNTSWQGTIIWLEGRREQSFRSVLELIQLMDSAMQVEEQAS